LELFDFPVGGKTRIFETCFIYNASLL